ncbi:MAG: class I SAM-dependent methyltransferase [Mobilitalea sp.]
MNEKESIKKTKQSFEKSFSEKSYYDAQTQDKKQMMDIFNILSLRENMNILDLGTGSGYLAFPLAKQNPTCCVIGLDIVTNTLEDNREKVLDNHMTNLDFAEYDGIDFPFEEETFDLIVVRFALHHFPDIKKAFAEMSRVLKKGGQLFISDPTPNDNDTSGFVDAYMQTKHDGHIKFYFQKEYTELAQEAGFVLNQYFSSEIRFPRKTTEESLKILADFDSQTVEGYHIRIEDDEIFITEKVLNMSFVKR